MKNIAKTLCAVIIVSVSALSYALTGEEIVHKANLAAYYQGNDGRSTINMTVRSGAGKERNKEFIVLRLNKEEGGEQKFYVYYRKPDDIRDTVYMVWKKVTGDDDRWLYLPGLNLVTRVAASDKRSKFAGSDFVYEDISGRNINEDVHELIKEDDNVYMLKNVPKDPSSVEFSYYEASIDKKTFLPKEIKYYDTQGKVMRVVENLEVKDIQGYPTTVKAIARDLRSGSETTLEFTNVEYNIGLTEDIFTERYLQRLPRKWLK